MRCPLFHSPVMLKRRVCTSGASVTIANVVPAWLLANCSTLLGALNDESCWTVMPAASEDTSYTCTSVPAAATSCSLYAPALNQCIAVQSLLDDTLSTFDQLLWPAADLSWCQKQSRHMLQLPKMLYPGNGMPHAWPMQHTCFLSMHLSASHCAVASYDKLFPAMQAPNPEPLQLTAAPVHHPTQEAHLGHTPRCRCCCPP